MTVPEVATTLGVSVTTVESDWRMARAWLARALDARSS
jgi:DNA-directed RNA polymerase specialized sigma24 family protein